MLEISDTGLCTRHGLQVFIHPDDAKDRVLMAIVEALLERNNLPTSTKELASLIIQEGYTRLGGFTPHGTVASRISLHFKRTIRHEPPRPPLLARHDSLLNPGKHIAKSARRGRSCSTGRPKVQQQTSKVKTAVIIEGQQCSSNPSWPPSMYIPPMALAFGQSTLSLCPPEWPDRTQLRYMNDLSPPSAEQFGDTSVLPSSLCHLGSSLFPAATWDCDIESTYLGIHQMVSSNVDDSESILLPSLDTSQESGSTSSTSSTTVKSYPSDHYSNATAPIPSQSSCSGALGDRSSQPELTDDSQSFYDSSSSSDSGSQLPWHNFFEYPDFPGDDMHRKLKKYNCNDDLLLSSTTGTLTPAAPLGISPLAEILDLIHDKQLDFTALHLMVSTEPNLTHLAPVCDLITPWIVHLKQQRTPTSSTEAASPRSFDTLVTDLPSQKSSLCNHQQAKEEHNDTFGHGLPASPTDFFSTLSTSVYFTTIDTIPVCVAQLLCASSFRLVRRLDLDYIEGTSLLAAGGVDSKEARGIILSLEKDRLVVCKSDSGLYGTWIPLVRARHLAATCSIQYQLDSFLDDDIELALSMNTPRRITKSSSSSKEDNRQGWTGSMGTRNGMFVRQARCADLSLSMSLPRPFTARKRKRRPLSLAIKDGDYDSTDDSTDTDPEIEQLRKRLKKKRQAAISTVDKDPTWDDLISRK